MEFEKWFKESGYDEQHKEFARICWNACADSATEFIGLHYDENEPWVTPGEVKEFLTL